MNDKMVPLSAILQVTEMVGPQNLTQLQYVQKYSNKWSCCTWI